MPGFRVLIEGAARIQTFAQNAAFREICWLVDEVLLQDYHGFLFDPFEGLLFQVLYDAIQKHLKAVYSSSKMYIHRF